MCQNIVGLESKVRLFEKHEKPINSFSKYIFCQSFNIFVLCESVHVSNFVLNEACRFSNITGYFIVIFIMNLCKNQNLLVI